MILIFTLSYIGNVYIADMYNNRIRKVTVSTGIITTIAGSGGTGTFTGDGGLATSATFNYPSGVALDSSGRNNVFIIFIFFLRISFISNTGNVYIADLSNNRIRKVTVSTGIITTIAGSSTGGYSGDNGAATSASLYSPIGVALDLAGSFTL